MKKSPVIVVLDSDPVPGFDYPGLIKKSKGWMVFGAVQHIKGLFSDIPEITHIIVFSTVNLVYMPVPLKKGKGVLIIGCNMNLDIRINTTEIPQKRCKQNSISVFLLCLDKNGCQGSLKLRLVFNRSQEKA
jgi:hypothetical protein